MSKISKKDKFDFRRKQKIRWSIIAAVAVILALAVYILIERSGHWLVDDDEFTHAKWVAVLDGQSADLERSEYAAGLLADGKVDSVLILGRRVFRNRSNAEFYADDFMRLGKFDSNAVFIAPHNDPSSISEAYSIIPWLKAHKADTVLILTAAASTHRVKRIFQKLAGNSPVFLTVDIHHVLYNANCWYNNRESRKDWLRSWSALFASYIDTFNADTLEATDSAYYKPIKSLAELERENTPSVSPQKMLSKMEEKIRKEVAKTATAAGKE